MGQLVGDHETSASPCTMLVEVLVLYNVYPMEVSKMQHFCQCLLHLHFIYGYH